MLPEKKTCLMLNSGHKLPLKGFGTYQITENVGEIIKKAIEVGYRHFDTAKLYNNEEQIGKAIKEVIVEGKVKREEIFLTTKIWNDEKDDVEKSLREALKRLQMDYVDLYLIHWPMGYYDNDQNLVLKPLYKTWKEMEECVKKGLCKSIGVSNFNVQLLLDLLSYAEIKPAVNEIEFHPYLQQTRLVKFCQKFGIQIIAYSLFTRDRLSVLEDPTIAVIAKKHKRNPNEIILKWAYDMGIAGIPKTKNPDRMKENFNFDDIGLDEEDVKKIESLHCGKRISMRICDEVFKIPLMD